MKETIVISTFIYVLILFIVMMFGMMSGAWPTRSWDCKGPKPRIEYLFPTYRLGCWLGQTED